MNRTELLKIAKPILFNTEMVRAILDGRKTVTRRVVKIPKSPEGLSVLTGVETRDGIVMASLGCINHPHCYQNIKAKYQPGDYLYVRETFCIDEDWDFAIRYRADFDNRTAKDMFTDAGLNWKPSIHMPKEAARIFLKVTGVRVERLQDITDEQAKKEGMRSQIGGVLQFKWEWDLIYGNWSENPWVWVYEFERAIHDA